MCSLYARISKGWNGVDCCRILSVPLSSVWAKHLNIILDSCPGAWTVWQVVVLCTITRALVHFFCNEAWGVVGLQCSTHRTGRGGCRILVLAENSVQRPTSHCGLVLFLDLPFGTALAYLGYLCSPEIPRQQLAFWSLVKVNFYWWLFVWTG